MQTTIQTKINCNDNNTIDYDQYNDYVKDLIERGFKKTLPEDLLYQDQIKMVVNIDGNEYFRSGGWVLKVNEDEDDDGNDWLLIKSHSKGNFTIPLESIVEIYALSKQNQKQVSIYKKPDETLKYKLYIKNKEGKNILIYSTNDKSKIERAKKTNKYKNAINTGNIIIK